MFSKSNIYKSSIFCILLVLSIFLTLSFVSASNIQSHPITEVDEFNISGDTINLNQSYNLNVTLNITADTGFFNLDWGFITGLPDIIYSLWPLNNNNNLLISNGTAVGYNETILNDSIISVAGTVYIQNSTNVDFLDVNASSATIHGDLNVTGTSYLGNLTMGNKITMALGVVWEAISSEWAKITGSLQITGDLNVTKTGEFENITIRDNYICNKTVCFTLQDLNTTIADTWALNYTYYYPKSEVYNTTEIYTKAEIDTNITGQGYIKSANVAYVNESNVFAENQNFSKNLSMDGGDILLNNNATITREGVGTKTWLSESGNWITQFGE